MNKVGRPVKYTDEYERNETRRIQNRENQRRCRKRKKLLNELQSFSTTQNNRNKEYRINLVDFFKQFDFNYFFTGTIDMNYVEKEKFNERNNEIKQLNLTLQTNLSYETERKIGIKSLREYTEKYIKHLSDLKLIERCFVVFEGGKNKKYHIHILFGSNPNLIDFDRTTENRWLFGNSITIPILTQYDKENLLSYSVKELNPSSTKMDDLNKIDNWFFTGDYLIDCHRNYKKSITQFIPINLNE